MTDESSGGKIEAIWIKRAKLGPMDPVVEAEMVEGQGLVGNANQGGRRQVTVLDADVWQRVTDALGAELDPAARRANILVRGVDLENSRGRILQLGSCRLRIYNETTPCERMEEVFPGLEAALRPNWGGGAFGEVIQGGSVRVGEPAVWRDCQE